MLPKQKGLALDDTTFQNCPGSIPRKWPNTQENITSLRMFKAWDGQWPDEGRTQAWQQIKDFVEQNEATVLLGTQITCNETDDDRDWRLMMELLPLLGRKRVMAVAVGNEMELLQFKSYVSKNCTRRIWEEGYFWNKTQAPGGESQRHQ